MVFRGKTRRTYPREPKGTNEEERGEAAPTKFDDVEERDKVG
jgi:hypothetical protein